MMRIGFREDYTEVRPCVVQGWPDAHTVWLRVGVQEFCTASAMETKAEAEQFRTLLVIALGNMVEAERKAV